MIIARLAVWVVSGAACIYGGYIGWACTDSLSVWHLVWTIWIACTVSEVLQSLPRIFRPIEKRRAR